MNKMENPLKIIPDINIGLHMPGHTCTHAHTCHEKLKKRTFLLFVRFLRSNFNEYIHLISKDKILKSTIIFHWNERFLLFGSLTLSRIYWKLQRPSFWTQPHVYYANYYFYPALHTSLCAEETHLTCPWFGNSIRAQWCPGTRWKDLPICRDLNCEGQNDLEASITCVCRLDWGARRLDLVWDAVSLWHRLLRVAPRFQDRGKLPRDPAVTMWPFMTRPCWRYLATVQLAEQTQGHSDSRGRKQTATQSCLKKKSAAIKRTATCINTSVLREILESWILKTERDHRGLCFHLSSQLSWQLPFCLLSGPLQVFLTGLLTSTLASLLLKPQTEWFFPNMSLLPNIPYAEQPVLLTNPVPIPCILNSVSCHRPLHMPVPLHGRFYFAGHLLSGILSHFLDQTVHSMISLKDVYLQSIASCLYLWECQLYIHISYRSVNSMKPETMYAFSYKTLSTPEHIADICRGA